MVGEIVVFAVFKDEDAAVFQQLPADDEVGNLGQFLQCVWRVGKDEVILLPTAFQESEHIAADGDARLGIELLQTVLYEAVVVTVHLDAHHLLASA